MKVLFGYLTYEFRGGTKFQLDFAEKFEELEVGFVTSNKKVKYQERVEAIGKINVVPPTKHFLKRYQALKILAKEYDIIYLNKATLTLIEMFLIKSAGFKKIVFHSHSTGKDCKNPIIKKMYHAFHYISRPFVGMVTDKMYACSPEAGKWLFGNVFLKQGVIVNNGIDSAKFRYNEEMRQQMRIELGVNDFCVMHAGAFSDVKNQGYLIEAFAEFHKNIPKSTLIFAGSGELLDNAIEKAKQLGLGECVKFLGQRNDICNVMQAADLFVLPSKFEGLPFVAMEAQAAGLPCIITSAASKMVKITDLCEFYDVQKSPIDLAKVMESKMNKNRIDTFEEIKNAGFDLKECVRKLEKELIELC